MKQLHRLHAALSLVALLLLAPSAWAQPAPGDIVRIAEISELDSVHEFREQLVGETAVVVGGVLAWDDGWWAMTARITSGARLNREEVFYKIKYEPLAAQTGSGEMPVESSAATLADGTTVRVLAVGAADPNYIDRRTLEAQTATLLGEARQFGDWWRGELSMRSGPRTGEAIGFREVRLELATVAAAPEGVEVVRILEIDPIDAFYADRAQYMGQTAELVEFERNWDAGWQKVRLKMLSGRHAGSELGFYKIRYQPADRAPQATPAPTEQPARAGDAVRITAIFAGSADSAPDTFYDKRDELVGYSGQIEEVEIEWPDGWNAAKVRMDSGPSKDAVIPFFKVKYERLRVAAPVADTRRPLGGKNILKR